MTPFSIVLVFCILFIIYIIGNWLAVYIKSSRIKSTIDNRYYTVRNVDPEYNKKSADLLATVNQRAQKLINELNKQDNKEHQINVDLLTARYNPDTIMENILQIDTSFTIEKGTRLEICLDDRKPEPKFEGINTLMMVTIHELAHMSSITYGHNDEFKKNFAFLLKKGIEIGIYEYVDYSKNPISYCGMDITNNII
jgi:hypothetical protein